ncbi:salicylic acid-binding protein 2-like [Cucurbita pepo subsp. pepo]|uniref:salicylic acid-binding protein 2-like n=1 Tax=Cucurbita pepo subsp. pepo TaxID=3664 RepID=UPI000C9D2B5D|nr:salicylic acid-binding protein 2-like [Cucurbita pepo subsp. pepo]
MEQKHFVLVHGACHGAWCWFKIKPLLEAAGHRVTLLDMAASGIHRKVIQDVHSIVDYSEPLLKFMACLPPNQKLILVGHSLGGFNLAVAMDRFPDKIAASVFVAAFVPDTNHMPSYVLDQYNEQTPMEAWLDTQFSPYGNEAEPSTSMFFGPNFLAKKLYQLSPPEDLALGLSLLRPSSLFMQDLSKANNFSKQRYGSVKKVYIVCTEDKGIPEEFQKWMIHNSGIENVMEINGSDHMPMFCKPRQLLHCLLQVAVSCA